MARARASSNNAGTSDRSGSEGSGSEVGMVAMSLTCCTAGPAQNDHGHGADEHAKQHGEIAQPGPVDQQDHGHCQEADGCRLRIRLICVQNVSMALTTLLVYSLE